MGRSCSDTGVAGRVCGAADEAHRFEAEQAVTPAGGVFGEHLRGDAQDGDVEEPVQQGAELADAVEEPAEQGAELADAVEGAFDELDVLVDGGVGVGDDAAGGELEDVRDANDVGLGLVLHAFGDGQQRAGLLEEAPAAGGERDVAAVADQQGSAELLLELADLFGQRGLGNVQPGRGPAEVQLVGEGDEVAHQSQVEVHVLPLRVPRLRTTPR
jgi:hypothetical protein